jgi:hypothetical protein
MFFKYQFSKNEKKIIFMKPCEYKSWALNYAISQGTLSEGIHSTVDLLIKVPYFVKKVNNIFNIKKFL